MESKIDYNGKFALITGASSGIGKEFACRLADRGANLVIASRNLQKLQDTAGDIREKHGTGLKVEIIQSDLEKPDSPQRLFDEINQKNIQVDYLINNAGFGHWSGFEDEPFEKTFGMNILNIVSLASLCHLFIPPMLERKAGGVINVASTAAFQPVPYMSNYAATKAYVLHFSLGLWQEYKDRGIRVMALCPGYTRTGFQEVAGMPAKFNSRLLTADEVVREALDAFDKGDPQYIPRKSRDFLQFTLSKFIPLKSKLGITADMFKPE